MTETSKPSSDSNPASPGSSGNELPKQYKPADHEERIRARWDAAKAFHADPQRVLRGEAKPYCIVIPPPNVTDRLHLGHALNNTLQDVLARSHRMMGFETLWMAGTDHAGIATQAVVERRLKKDEGLTRQQLGREKFVAKVQAFKDEYEKIITDQLKLMGCSCDWDRQRFTMDEVCARAVREAFFRLFKDGLIYRGKRLVNWDPVLQTAVSDDECYDEELDSSFYYLRYPLVHRGTALPGGVLSDPQPITWNELARRGYPGAEQHPGEEQAWVTVATTRPETYLGDTAVAVNPKDERANALRGLFVELPLVGRIIPIIEDDYVVLPAAMQADPEAAKSDPKAVFATGFLKVTPAHDPNDYEIGVRHKAAIEACGNAVLINMLAPDGSVSDKHGWTDVGDAHLFVGLPREKARKKVLEEFKARTVDNSSVPLLAETKPYRHSVKHSDRSKAIIEPYLSDQWYVKVTDDRLAPAANRALVAEQSSKQQSSKQQINASGDGELKFYPARYAKTYEQWHDGIRDWCISRQLWWGHQIAVWWSPPQSPDFSESDSTLIPPHLQIDSERAVRFIHKDRVGFCFRYMESVDLQAIRELEAAGWTRDTDVLDTWFSSALWPISTMGWPDPAAAGKDFEGLLQAFNPTTTLCTAREIITLWVSRMVMFERYLMPEKWETEKKTPKALESLAHNGEGRGPLPFTNVFIHAVIQDGEGRKMSKSLGNGLDPLDIIASHGSDAMRFTLCQMTTQTQDVRMPIVKDSATGRNTSPKFDLGRNFSNKLWNAARLVLSLLEHANSPPMPSHISLSALELPDRWILDRITTAWEIIEKSCLRNFDFGGYANVLYDIVWREYCDWYLETRKTTASNRPDQLAILRLSLDLLLRLSHPIMPYVSEVIYERLRRVPLPTIEGVTLQTSSGSDLLCLASWPKLAPQTLQDFEVERKFERIRTLVTLIREVRSQHGVVPRRKISLHLPVGLFESQDEVLVEMLSNVIIAPLAPLPQNAVSFSFESSELKVSDLRDSISAAIGMTITGKDESLLAAERERLQKVISDNEKSIATLEGRLNNPGYAQKAPPAMVKQTQDQLAKAKADKDAAAAALAAL